MTIYMAGSEMGTFIPDDSGVIESVTSGTFNSAFSRASTQAGNSSGFETPAFTGLTDFYTHAYLGTEPSASGTDLYPLIMVSNLGVDAVRLVYDRPTNTLTLDYHNGTTYVTAGSITIDMEGTNHDIDLRTVCNSATGSLTLYVAGTNRIAATGLNLASTASITKVRQVGATFGPEMSQLIVADEPTTGWRLITRYPNGTGANTDWTGTYAGIDEAQYSDADFVNSATANQVSMFTQTGPALTGYVVRAVCVTARAKKGASGPANLQLAIRSSSTNYFSSSHALDVGYGGFFSVWETDPATAADWVNTGADAIQIGVKSIT